jgi:hypothetical protein
VACEASENHVRERVALAGRLTGGSTGTCAGLVGVMPATGEALAAGQVSLAHARVLVETTTGLVADDVRLVEARVLGRAAGRPPARFRQICRRAVASVDAGAAHRRHDLARQERHVEWWPEPDGMARLHVYGPAPEVMAIHGAVDVLAGPRTPADDRTVGTRRFDALLRLCLDAVAPRAIDRAGSPPAGGAALDTPLRRDDRAAHPARHCAGERTEDRAEHDADHAADHAADHHAGDGAGDHAGDGVASRSGVTSAESTGEGDPGQGTGPWVPPQCGTKPVVQAQIVVDLPTPAGSGRAPR